MRISQDIPLEKKPACWNVFRCSKVKDNNSKVIEGWVVVSILTTSMGRYIQRIDTSSELYDIWISYQIWIPLRNYNNQLDSMLIYLLHLANNLRIFRCSKSNQFYSLFRAFCVLLMVTHIISTLTRAWSSVNLRQFFKSHSLLLPHLKVNEKGKNYNSHISFSCPKQLNCSLTE